MSGSPRQTAVALPLPGMEKEERLRRGGRPVCMVVVARLWHASALAAHLWCGVVCRPPSGP
jgi:hypothetical protein